MVELDEQRVAKALHREVSELPTGYEEDILVAEQVIEEYVEPHSDATHLIETTGVYVAAAFIAGSEGEAPLNSIQSETTSIGIDVANMSDVSRDRWARAKMIDPSGKLGDLEMDGPSFEFDAMRGRGAPPEEYRH